MVYAALKKLSPFKTAVAICQYAVINSTSSEPRNLHFKGFLNGVFLLIAATINQEFSRRFCDVAMKSYFLRSKVLKANSS